MRRYVVPTIVLAAVGFSVGVLYRFFVNPADQATLANYLRSGFHGAGQCYSGACLAEWHGGPLAALAV